MKAGLVAAAALACLLAPAVPAASAGPAQPAARTAPVAPLPDYAPGDAFVYDNGRVEQVVAIDGERVTWSAPGGRRYVRHRNFLLPLLEWRTGESEGTRRVAGRADVPWPLAAGRQARFQVVTDARVRTGADRERRRRTSELWTCGVAGVAPLTVRAGTFEAWEIRCDRYSPRSMRVLRRDTWWYAPEIGHYVRRDSVDLASGRRTSFQLAAALAGRDANPRRIRAILAAL